MPVNTGPVMGVFVVLVVIFGATVGFFVLNPFTSTTTKTDVSTSTVATTQTVTSTTQSVSVELAYKPQLGLYLTNASGFTLYFRSTDPGNGSSACTGGCLGAWPAIYVSNLALPSSLNALSFTLVNRPDGVKQLAYQGYPLYYYVKDTAPGQTTGEGLAHFTCCSVVSTSTTGSATTSTSTSTAT